MRPHVGAYNFRKFPVQNALPQPFVQSQALVQSLPIET
jgi:hypothetical protein